MEKKETQKHEHPLPGEIRAEQKKRNADALAEAEKDINNDPETKSDKKDDLDEGELARLGEDPKI